MDVRKKAGSKEARRETRHANTRGTETGHKTQRGYPTKEGEAPSRRAFAARGRRTAAPRQHMAENVRGTEDVRGRARDQRPSLGTGQSLQVVFGAREACRCMAKALFWRATAAGSTREGKEWSGGFREQGSGGTGGGGVGRGGELGKCSALGQLRVLFRVLFARGF
ncbi:hypothetical protein ERJ75_000690700 [Trypanosoma vivax]|nr:hypothetical protein ERJ75_000690700 [Trypanosoma vivax]